MEIHCEDRRDVCCAWGYLPRHSELLMSVRISSFHSLRSDCILHGFLSVSYPFHFSSISHCTVSSCFCSTQRQCQIAIEYVTNPLDVLSCASSAANSANYTGKSVPRSLACAALVPVVPRVLLLPAGMAEGAGTTVILDHPDYSSPVIIIISPSRQGVFHFKL